MFVDALQNLLITDAGMVAKLGTPASRSDSTNGVFPTQAPDQPTMPYVVYSTVSGESLSVTYQGTGPLVSERWRISCYGTTYKNAKLFSKYVRLLLLSWNGAQAVGAVMLQGAFFVTESDETESMARGTLFSTHVDFIFVYVDNDASD